MNRFNAFSKPLITSRKSIAHLSNAEFGFNTVNCTNFLKNI
jgi:hypothetical protein